MKRIILFNELYFLGFCLGFDMWLYISYKEKLFVLTSNTSKTSNTSNTSNRGTTTLRILNESQKSQFNTGALVAKPHFAFKYNSIKTQTSKNVTGRKEGGRVLV